MSEYLCRQLYWKRILSSQICFYNEDLQCHRKEKKQLKECKKRKTEGLKRSKEAVQMREVKRRSRRRGRWFKRGLQLESRRALPWRECVGEERPDEQEGLKGTLQCTIKVHEPCTFLNTCSKIWALKTLSSISSASQVHFYRIWRETFLLG